MSAVGTRYANIPNFKRKTFLRQFQFPYTRTSLEKTKQPNDRMQLNMNSNDDTDTNIQHPGGPVIFTHAGDDFTDIFAAFHPASAYKALEPFLIGHVDDKCVLKKPEAQREFEEAYRKLRHKLVMSGMFKARYMSHFMSNYLLRVR